MTTSRYRWVILGIATFTQAAAAFFVQGIGAMSVHLQRDLELNTTRLGLLLSAAQLLPLAGLLVAGRLLDRYGERWIVGTGALVVALALAAGRAAPGYVSLLVVLLIVGAGYSTIQPGGSKSVASWFDASQRGLAMGIRQAGLPLGGVLAAVALPALATACGWRSTLMAGALVALSGAVAFMAFYRHPPDQRPVPTTSRVSLELLRESYMKKIILSGASMVSVHGGVGVLTVLYLHEVTSMDSASVALVYVAVQCAGALGRILLATWSDHHRSGRYACVLTCLTAVVVGMTMLTTPIGRSTIAACLLFIWLGFFGIGWYGPWVAYAAESAPPDRTGSALGLAMAVNQVAVILAPPMLGLLTDMTNSFAPAWALLAALTAATLTTTARL
ncbi:MFS transporter [Sphaerisporangium rufum]|uniref:MFS transporter n=1 Tax=Sphaerisporangium rufum TaxID=1381558 RepID=A0A919QYY6_9ACTN|nr:MFS transporter [Sphaerisporangium rufum]